MERLINSAWHVQRPRRDVVATAAPLAGSRRFFRKSVDNVRLDPQGSDGTPANSLDRHSVSFGHEEGAISGGKRSRQDSNLQLPAPECIRPLRSRCQSKSYTRFFGPFREVQVSDESLSK
jgi:hypothetical protein